MDKTPASQNRVAVWILSLLVLALVLWFIREGWIVGYTKADAKRIQCLSNIKRLAINLMFYAADNEDHLPPPSGWYDSQRQFDSDPEIQRRCPFLEDGIGYAMNDAKQPTKSSDETWPLLFESTKLERNAHDPLDSLLETPRHEKVSIGFRDGHARFFKPVDGSSVREQLQLQQTTK